MNAQTNHGRLSNVAHVGHLLANATQTSRTHVSCADRRLKLHRVSPRGSQSPAISRTVNPLLLRTNVLTFAIISSFLDVDGRPERRSLSAEVLPSVNRGNQSNNCVRPITSSTYARCNNWYVSVAVFPILKQNLMQMRCSVLSHIVKIAMTNACVTSATYYRQLSKLSHLQLVSRVVQTCTNMSILVANTSRPGNHYNSNPDTSWTNLVCVEGNGL